LLVGAGFGRFVGLLVQLLFPSMKIDPGVYALIGASAFIGGVSRMTISMTVIILEITNDLQYLFPIMLVIMISKWVGDIFTHPLYDMLLHLKDVPYLESKPSYVMSKLKCSDIMVKPVIVLHETKETVEKIVQILASTDHNGFPVVRDCDSDSPLFHRSNSGPAISDSNFDDEERLSNTTIDMNLSSAQPKHKQILVGLISRKHLLILLKYTVLKNQRRFTEQELNSIVNGPHILLHRLVEKYTDEHWKKTLDLRDLVNYSSLYVNKQFSVEYAYQLFRSMGTRHLIVVNYHNQVVGMITRRDFLEKRLEEIYQKVKAKLNYYKRFQPNYYLSYLADQQI
jgi:chloride channel 7